MRTTAAECPHCAEPSSPSQRRRWGVVLGIAGVASLGLTMMACYGAPPCEPGTAGCPKSQNNDSATTGSAGHDGGANP